MNDPTSLIERARSGDPEALNALLALHLPRLRAFVRLKAGKLIRAKESSSDLVQSVCREVLGDLGRFECRDEVAFRWWLYETALRKILDRKRYYMADKRSAARELPLPSGSTPGDAGLLASYDGLMTPSANAIAQEEIERLERAFDELPAHYREVILQARVLGLSQAEIARRMGRTEDSVRNLLPRALALLSTRLSR